MPKELKIPDFLQETADDIHNRMLGAAPVDINLVEGDIFWDATRPSAEEKAELLQVKLQNTLRLAFAQTSYDEWLDLHGEVEDVFRNPPTKSSGYLKVTGTSGSYVPKDRIIYTESFDEPSIGFVVLESTDIGETGEAMVMVECVEAGVIGNVAANTIKIPDKAISGITSVTNPSPLTGGTELESDEMFRERVMAAYEESLSGSDSDYIRWTKKVPGVGHVNVIPEWEGFGTGTTKILIMDANGQPANEALIAQVQRFLAPPETKNRGGIAPVNANVTVSAPVTIVINISATIEIKDGYDEATVIKDLKQNLKDYLSSIKITVDDERTEYIYLEKIGHIILSTLGVEIYSDLKINNNISPVLIPIGEVPALGEVVVS